MIAPTWPASTEIMLNGVLLWTPDHVMLIEIERLAVKGVRN